MDRGPTGVETALAAFISTENLVHHRPRVEWGRSGINWSVLVVVVAVKRKNL